MRVGLTERQQQLLDTWLPSAVIVRDHSWGLIGTLVLELEHHGERYIAKAGDHTDHHLARESVPTATGCSRGPRGGARPS